jgi:hypothetical protein
MSFPQKLAAVRVSYSIQYFSGAEHEKSRFSRGLNCGVRFHFDLQRQTLEGKALSKWNASKISEPRFTTCQWRSEASAAMSSSPTKETVATLAPPPTIPSLNAPPSPHSHRALRRLKSAHTLGQSPSQPSLISQQHKQVLQRNLSPSKKDATGRARSNSDATNMTPPTLGSAGRRPIPVRKSTTEMLSLDRLIRDGPPDGDTQGGLEATRLKILDQGIKSDSDGMVRPPPLPSSLEPN